jgi:beta-glucosidase-like glycosyl hydrolase
MTSMRRAAGAAVLLLAGLVAAGRIASGQIDEAVRPILAAKFRLGLFAQPYADEARAKEVRGAPAHRQEARRAAQKSLGYWSTAGGGWVQDAEAFDLWAGGDSTATLHADLRVTP